MSKIYFEAYGNSDFLLKTDEAYIGSCFKDNDGIWFCTVNNEYKTEFKTLTKFFGHGDYEGTKVGNIAKMVVIPRDIAKLFDDGHINPIRVQ